MLNLAQIGSLTISNPSGVKSRKEGEKGWKI